MRDTKNMMAVTAVCALLFVAGALAIVSFRSKQVEVAASASRTPNTLGELLSLPSNALAGVQVGHMNLLCAQELSPTNEPDVEGCLATLDTWAERVRSETERHLYRFKHNPAEFENSEGFFRMVMLAVVLAEDFRVKYAPAKMGTAADARVGDGFFRDAEAVFLHGLLGPRREGTCSSMPVLYVAVGRRLGYPLKLVTTKGHLFVRWEDGNERFNVEATSRGVNRFPDEYYRHWPLEVTDEEVRAEGYLKSLSAAEELAAFLSIRGMCLEEAARYADAASAFREAARLSPACRSYGVMQMEMERRAGNAGSGVLEAKTKGERTP